LSDGGGGLLIIDWTNGAIIDYWHDDPDPSVKHRSLLAFVETIMTRPPFPSYQARHQRE
jgi:hypothetical protein